MTRIHANTLLARQVRERAEEKRTLKAEIGKQGNIFGALLALGQLGEDEEASPAMAAQPHALEAHSQVVKVGLGNIAALHDTHSPKVLKSQVDERGDDADGEDPFRDIEANGGGNLRRPAVKGQELNGCEGIDTVDGDRQYQREPEVDVGEYRKAARGLEVAEILAKGTVSNPHWPGRHGGCSQCNPTSGPGRP